MEEAANVMTLPRQNLLPLAEAKSLTFAGRVAAYFRARPGVWIDGRDISQIAGCYGWRTRISDIRRAPFFMRVDTSDLIREYGLTDAELDFLRGHPEFPTRHGPVQVGGSR